MNFELELADHLRRTLRLIADELKNIRDKLGPLQDIVSQMIEPDFDNLRYQVAALAEGLKELEDRVSTLERHTGLARWVARQVGTVAVIIVVVWLIGLLR